MTGWAILIFSCVVWIVVSDFTEAYKARTEVLKNKQ